MGTNVFLSGNVSSGLTDRFGFWTDSFFIVGAMLVEKKKKKLKKYPNWKHKGGPHHVAVLNRNKTR